MEEENIGSLYKEEPKWGGEVGSGGRRPLCDSSGGSSCNGSSLSAGLNGDGGGNRGRRSNRGSSRSRLSSLLGLVLAVARDVAGLRALIANLAGGAQRATVGSGAVTGDMTLTTVSMTVSMQYLW